MPCDAPQFSSFLQRYEAALELLAGRAKGSRVPLDQPRFTIGRGPGVDLAFADADMAREHVVLEFFPDGFHLTDADPRGSVTVNRAAPTDTPLKHGDRFRVAGQLFEFRLVDKPGL